MPKPIIYIYYLDMMGVSAASIQEKKKIGLFALKPVSCGVCGVVEITCPTTCVVYL